MGLLNFLGALSPAHINFFTLMSGGQRVGQDSCGNTYYRAKARAGYKRERRWVMFEGAPEASKVPPEWHGWLHYQTDDVPDQAAPSFRKFWQKPHQENLSGTTWAYRPPGHVTNGGQRDKATGDYTAWVPPQ